MPTRIPSALRNKLLHYVGLKSELPTPPVDFQQQSRLSVDFLDMSESIITPLAHDMDFSSAYIDAHDAAKLKFFDVLLKADRAGALCLSFLLKHIQDCPDLKSVFHKRVGSDTRSEAAVLLRALLRAFGIVLESNIFKSLIQGDFPDDLAQNLLLVPDQYYQQQGSLQNRQWLELELKQILQLYPPELTLDLSPETCLADGLMTYESPEILAKALLQIQRYGPSYFPELIEALSHDCASRACLLAVYVREPQLQEALSGNNIKLSHDLLAQDPGIFATLPSVFQAQLHHSLMVSADNEEKILLGQLDQVMADEPAYKARMNTMLIKSREALYQKFLVDQALLLAGDHPLAKGRFDMQGRYLCEVTLEDDDYRGILKLMQVTLPQEPYSPKKCLAKALGVSHVTTTTLCSIDVAGIPALENAFTNFLDAKWAQSWMKSESRGSLIALQTELEMHIRLAARVMKTYLAEQKLDWSKIHHQAASNIAVEMRNVFRNCYRVHLGSMAGINKSLDELRPDYASLAKLALIEACIEVCGDDVDFSQLYQEHVLDKISKRDFSQTTASGCDFLHSDARNQTITRISGTHKTAHDKTFFDANTTTEQQGFRRLHRSIYRIEDEACTVAPSLHARAEARVPSIAVKSDSLKASLEDVNVKLQHNFRQLSMGQEPQKPLVYHLLTSFWNKGAALFFDMKNAQVPSAEAILLGAHTHNMRSGSKGLVLVQNIPVNQHSEELSHAKMGDVIKEATLMAELALLNTITAHSAYFPPRQRASLDKLVKHVMAQYRNFLKPELRKKAYFHEDPAGQAAKKMLKKGKYILSHLPAVELTDNSDMSTLVATALLRCFVQNTHWDKQFGMLIQSLSIFLAPMSQSGCKSANERYQACSGRVELLFGMSARSGNLSKYEAIFIDQLRNFASGGGTADELQAALDTAYNQHNLQAANSHFSLEDQGGASKVVSSKNYGQGHLAAKEINTNIAESAYLNFLHQKNASAMQAHKGDQAKALNVVFDSTLTNSHSFSNRG